MLGHGFALSALRPPAKLFTRHRPRSKTRDCPRPRLSHLSSTYASASSRITPHPFQNRPYRNPTRPIRNPRFTLIVPGTPSNIQMNPRSLSHKLLQKHRSRDRPTPAIGAGIPHICNLALDLLFIIIRARQSPELLPRHLRSIRNLLPCRYCQEH